MVSSKMLEVGFLEMLRLGYPSTKLINADTSENKEMPVDKVGCSII